MAARAGRHLLQLLQHPTVTVASLSVCNVCSLLDTSGLSASGVGSGSMER